MNFPEKNISLYLIEIRNFISSYFLIAYFYENQDYYPLRKVRISHEKLELQVLNANIQLKIKKCV